MTKSSLFAGTSAIAFACFVHTAMAAILPNTVSGGEVGGSALMNAEFITFNAAESGSKTISSFGTGYASPQGLYFMRNSGAGIQAAIYDNILCLLEGAWGNDAACGLAANNTNPNANAGGVNSTDFVLSGALLDADEWAIWHGTYTGTSSATTTHGQSTAGNIIQIPAFGTPIVIAIQNSSVTANNQVSLTSADICGIFSGMITNWTQTSAYIKDPLSLTPGQITVVYRSDRSGETAIFSRFLSQACDSENSFFPGASNTDLNNTAIWDLNTYTFGNTYFTSLFNNEGTTQPLPTGAIGKNGSVEVISALQGLTSAITYLTPDYTTISTTGSSNGPNNYGVVVANVNGVEPTTANTLIGLENPGAGSGNGTPPNAVTSARQDSWVPIIPAVTKGYPIIGYMTFVFPQCFSAADKSIATGLIDFLTDHYTNASYLSAQESGGFIPLRDPQEVFVNAIEENILKTSSWNFSINNTTACAGLAGR